MDEEVLAKYKKAGAIAKAARNLGAARIKEGVLLLDVAEEVEGFIIKQGGFPAFPLNLTINDAAAHFTPASDDKTRFQRGDVVKLDVGVSVDGYVGDTAVTIEVGTQHWGDMIRATKEALDAAINLMKPKTRLDDVGAAIQRIIESFGFSPVENLTGHSMERYTLHAGLSVPNVMGEGSGSASLWDVIAIEPFATDGAGIVDGKKSGNIYRLTNARKVASSDLNRLIEHISSNYRTLPFSERWCHRYERKAKAQIRKLQKMGIIHAYPVLRDIESGTVAQSEHTVIVVDGGCETIT